MVGIALNGKIIRPDQLQAEMATAGVAVPNGLGTDGLRLWTYDGSGSPADLPNGATAVVAAHTPVDPEVAERQALATLIQDIATAAQAVNAGSTLPGVKPDLVRALTDVVKVLARLARRTRADTGIAG